MRTLGIRKRGNSASSTSIWAIVLWNRTRHTWKPRSRSVRSHLATCSSRSGVMAMP